MIIETKYNIGDEVWVNWRTIPTKMVVKTIDIQKHAHAEDIWYFVVTNDNLNCLDVNECELFPTKEELLKSL